MGSDLGLSDDKLMAVLDWPVSDLFDDDLFARLRARWDDDTLVELTETIAWENASSKFNRALRIPSQHLWRRPPPAGDV